MGELNLKQELKAEILQGFSYQYQMSDEEISQVIDEKISDRIRGQPIKIGRAHV